jgi:hypothetical protein
MLLGAFVRLFFQVVDPGSDVAHFAFGYEVGELVGMAAGFPDEGMHKYAAIEADDVVAHLNDALPPAFPDVVLQLYAQRAVVVAACEAAVDFAGLKYEAPPFAQRNNIIELGYLGHAIDSVTLVCEYYIDELANYKD